jgi:hypothetical protein
MIKIENEFTISATPDLVWKVISEVDRYEAWNTFVSRCKSTLIPGDAIFMRVHLLPFPIWQKETIISHEPGRLLDYGISLPFNLLKSSRKHKLEILVNGDVHYSSCFQLEGLLAPLVSLFMEKKLQQGFARMATDLHTEIIKQKSAV